MSASAQASDTQGRPSPLASERAARGAGMCRGTESREGTEGERREQGENGGRTEGERRENGGRTERTEGERRENRERTEREQRENGERTEGERRENGENRENRGREGIDSPRRQPPRSILLLSVDCRLVSLHDCILLLRLPAWASVLPAPPLSFLLPPAQNRRPEEEDIYIYISIYVYTHRHHENTLPGWQCDRVCVLEAAPV